MNKIIVMGIVISAIIAGAVILNVGEYAKAPTDENTPITTTSSIEDFVVNITSDGYDNREFTIAKGQGIIFKNKTADGNFWPASNIHPTHEIYPEFDPEEPIPPGKEWRIVFDREGEWRWHDHLRPSIRGVITVK